MSSPPLAPIRPLARYNVLGVGVHALDLAQARDRVIAAARERRAKTESGAATDQAATPYVCFCDVNSISCARRDPAHGAILNRAFLATPDGMPLVWLGRHAGHKEVGRVYGPDLLEAVCAATANTELTHYFYGAAEGTAAALAEKLSARFPGLRVAGAEAPPFRELTLPEASELEKRIRPLRPDFFWVGLSTPKQEKFMAAWAPRLGGGPSANATAGMGASVGVMLGVGAAFDFLSGRVRQAPRWLQRTGLEWVFRLAMEPRRLAPRYFKNNPLFVARVAAQMCGVRSYPPDGA